MSPDDKTAAGAGEIIVSDRQAFSLIDLAAVEAVIAGALAAEGRMNAGEVSVTFVDVAEMTRLNSTYRGKEGPTDVLSFAAQETAGDDGFVSSVDILGDIVVCPAIAAANAVGQGHSANREIMEMVLHGLLHLLGYGHGTAADETAMLAKQAALAKQLLGETDRA